MGCLVCCSSDGPPGFAKPCLSLRNPRHYGRVAIGRGHFWSGRLAHLQNVAGVGGKGMVLYLANVLYGLSQGRFGVLAVVFLFAFLNAIRGTFALHRFSQEGAEPAGPPLFGGRL